MNSDRQPPARPVRALSVHARYACAHSGECCRAGWPIPVESHVLPVLRQSLADATVVPARPGPRLTWPDERLATAPAVLGRDTGGVCVFFDEGQREGACRVHRHAGMQALPISCRQFPRIARHDARGVDVSLSHWCPTALTALARNEPITISEAPEAFTDAAAYEGLDARATWPPLLRPGCLFDFGAYGILEHYTVGLLTRPDVSPWTSLGQLGCWWEQLRAWRSRGGTLVALTTRLAEQAPSMPPIVWDRSALRVAMRVALRTAVPDTLRTTMADPGNDASAIDDVWSHEPEARRLAGRHLAARFFGSWIAYQGNGLRAQLAGLVMALVALEDAMVAAPPAGPRDRTLAAIRAADLALIHLAVPEAVAREACRFDTVEAARWPPTRHVSRA
jgi:hypothetical protein